MYYFNSIDYLNWRFHCNGGVLRVDLDERVRRIAGRGLSRFSTDSDLALVCAQLVCVLLVGGDVARHAEAPGDPMQEQRTSPRRQLYVVVVHAVVVYLRDAQLCH